MRYVLEFLIIILSHPTKFCQYFILLIENFNLYSDEDGVKHIRIKVRPNKTLNTSDDNTQNKPVEESSVDTSAEHVKELEDELLKLRIENAFLKELRRLRLEDEAKMRERQESSVASEDSSN